MSTQPVRSAILLGLTSVLLTPFGVRAEIVDRIITVVGGRAIAWSAVYEEARYQAFRKEEEPPAWSASAAASEGFDAVLAALIDQTLLQQAFARSPFALSGSEDISARL